MAREINSLPVPVSPRINTVESVGATRSTSASTASRAGLLPIICSNLRSAESCSLAGTLFTPSTNDPMEAGCNKLRHSSFECSFHIIDQHLIVEGFDQKLHRT